MMVGIFIIVSCHVLSQERLSNAQDKDAQILISRDVAVKEALEYSGFEKMKGFSAKGNLDTSELVEINNDNTPFLHDKINGRKLWKVVMKDIYLHFEENCDTYDTIPRIFEIYINAENGQLCKIEMKYSDNNYSLHSQPPSEIAEQTLKNQKENYHGFVGTKTNISFYEALRGGGVALSAKKINAILVEHSYFRSENKFRPAWVITYSGVPPSEMEKVEVNGRYHLRHVVDAESGELILVTVNIP
ncbi:MAG: hypothetical protein AB1746_02850 [Candidatus Zixiibacteriota bacterium]